VELPHALQLALAQELTGTSARNLAHIAADLSHRYRDGAPATPGPFLQSRADVAAYAAVRLPATFGATYAALAHAADRLPEWTPETMLDVGAGPGTASWAATEIWPDVRGITLLERDVHMIALGQRLAVQAPLSALRDATWQRADITGVTAMPPHDLVIAAYVIGELGGNERLALIGRLWEAARGLLVVIEPGTPPGFQRIRQARDLLLAQGAHTLAPCPHDQPCPMAGENWCHFSQRVARSRLHRQVKGGELAYEDEKFAYVALARMPGTPIPARVIRHPLIQKGLVQLELCTPEGLASATITRKEKARFRQARDLRWGDAVADDDSPLPGPNGDEATDAELQTK
jgi:ribosomal protein RSM22 (predicted rRNA methylase)